MVAPVRYFTCEKCGAGGSCLGPNCPECGWDLDRVPEPAVAQGPRPIAVPVEINPPVPSGGSKGWTVR